MKRIFTISFIFLATITYSQEGNEEPAEPSVDNVEESSKPDARIELIFDKDKKKLTLNREKKKPENKEVGSKKSSKKVPLQRNLELNKDKTYEVVIKGLNTATTSSKIEFKPFTFSSKTPEIIKPIFTGITESGEVENLLGSDDQQDSLATKKDSLIQDLKEIYKQSLGNYNKLLFLKNQSDDLHKTTRYKADNQKANDIFDSIRDRFEIIDEKIETLNNEVLKSQKFIESSKKLFFKYLEELDAPNVDLLELYAQLEFFVSEIEERDYRKFSNFVNKSRTSKNQTDPVSFSPSKDGVDLDILLVNTYVNDTILKKPFSVYSSGGLSFDFTTGFFYSDLVERSYYLRGREGDTTKTNIIREDTRDLDISFGALGHVSIKVASSFKVGLSMGASLSPLDGKTRYLIGGSAIFGRRNQVAINGGVSFAKIKILSGSVEEDSVGIFVPTSVTVVPTFERSERGLYIGITYNLTSNKKFSK